MSFPTLPVIVVAEICLFQFVSIGLTRSLFSVYLGKPPEGISDRVARYLSRVARFRFAIGGLLGLVVLTVLLGWPADPGVRKLVLAVVSVTSALAFGAGFVSDQQTVRSLVKTLPESAVRRASLAPRSIDQWYAPAWEVVPLVILGSTAAFVLWMASTSSLPEVAWAMLGLQAAFVVGALFYTLRFGSAVPNVSQRVAALRDRPEIAMRLGERLAAREMQYMMLAKNGVALLLGVSVVHAVLRDHHHELTPWLGVASWVLVGLLMLAFAGYIVQVTALVRRTMQDSEQPRTG